MFRHSPDLDATLYPNTTSLARAVTGDQTHVFLPLKPGTYFARVYDADGRPSENFAYVSTKQASVLAFAPVDDVHRGPDVHRHQDHAATLVSGGLTLDAEDFDTSPTSTPSPSWDVSGGVASTGLYEFAAGIDMGAVTRARITSHVLLEAINEHDYLGRQDRRDRHLAGRRRHPRRLGRRRRLWQADRRQPRRLADLGRRSCGSNSAEITARAIGELECRLSTDDRAFNLWLTELRVTADEVV